MLLEMHGYVTSNCQQRVTLVKCPADLEYVVLYPCGIVVIQDGRLGRTVGHFLLAPSAGTCHCILACVSLTSVLSRTPGYGVHQSIIPSLFRLSALSFHGCPKPVKWSMKRSSGGEGRISLITCSRSRYFIMVW